MEQTRNRKIEEGWKIKVDNELKKRSRVFSGREHRPLHYGLVTQTQLSKNITRQEKYLSSIHQQEAYNASLKGQGF